MLVTELMTESFYKKVLLDAKADLLKNLAGLASKDRTAAEVKRFAADADFILRNLAEIESKLDAGGAPDPGRLDYREDVKLYVSIIRYLTDVGRPASEYDLTKEVIRGQFPGYKDAHRMAIRVGRCIRNYTKGNGKQNPKLNVHPKTGLVGLPNWPDDKFKS